MNVLMATSAQNSKILDFIVEMAFVYVMNIQLAINCFTDKALVLVMCKSPLSIHTRTRSVIIIISIATFKRVKDFLLTCVIAIFRRFISRPFSDVRLPTIYAGFFNYSSISIKVVLPAKTGTISNGSRLVFSNVSWSFLKDRFAKLARKSHKFVTGHIVTMSGAIGSSIFFKLLIACWASFHKPSLTLAMVNVNHRGSK